MTFRSIVLALSEKARYPRAVAYLLGKDEAVAGGVLEPRVERVQGGGRAGDRGAAAPGLDLDEAGRQLPGGAPVALCCAPGFGATR